MNEISFVLSLPFRGVFSECIFIVIYCYDEYDNLQWIVIGFFLCDVLGLCVCITGNKILAGSKVSLKKDICLNNFTTVFFPLITFAVVLWHQCVMPFDMQNCFSQ